MYREKPMLEAADASDAVATDVMPEASDAQISATAIRNGFKMTLSYRVCEKKWLRGQA